MAAYRQVYDSRHLQDDYQEPGSAPEPYVRQSSIGYLYFFTSDYLRYQLLVRNLWMSFSALIEVLILMSLSNIVTDQ